MNALNRTPRTVVGVDTDTDLAPSAMTPRRGAPLVPPKKALLDYVPALLRPYVPTAEQAMWSGVGALAGAILWKKHRILGAVAGIAAGRTAKSVWEKKGVSKHDVVGLIVPGAFIGSAYALQHNRRTKGFAKKFIGLPAGGAAIGAALVASYGLRAAGMK